MEPVEVNAGSWYLRAMRADDRVDDRPALRSMGITDPGYVEQRARQWVDDEHYSWAICEPTSGEMLAEVGLTLTDGTALLEGRARDGHDGALADGEAAVRRFAESGLGLTVESEWPS
ncbi:hypothetical protein G4X40_01590 [Rhodococcus sp. D2-41]|uniref:hypothetical protein n=1 Tax=Speluncibacter jeojiensis TaxID=2710754 RepID=UPI00240F3575|nr:hypothetical protein [Rhodococcus sp. D2-41]MDG3008836.1 hypothetical protein [Rhodococcus sp. D2-41]